MMIFNSPPRFPEGSNPPPIWVIIVMCVLILVMLCETVWIAYMISKTM